MRVTHLMFLCLFVGACATTQGKPRISRPAPQASDLLDQLRARSAVRTSIQALGRVTALGPDGRVRLRAVLVAKRPQSFRIETLSPFEQPIDVMASGGDVLWLLTQGKLHAGPASTENIARVLPLPLNGEELVELLLGGPPVTGDVEPVDIQVDGYRWRLVLKNAKGDLARLWVEPTQLNVVRAELMGAAGDMRIQLEMEDFQDLGDGGPPLPKLVRAQVPTRSLDVRIRFLETSVGNDIASSVFSLEPEDGSSVEPL